MYFHSPVDEAAVRCQSGLVDKHGARSEALSPKMKGDLLPTVCVSLFWTYNI